MYEQVYSACLGSTTYYPVRLLPHYGLGALNPTVRAIVYFTKNMNSTDELKQEIEHGISLLNTVEEHMRSLGYSVFTKRLSFPGLSLSLSTRVVDYLDKGFIASIGYLTALDPSSVVEIASLGLYVPVLYPGDPDIERARVYSEVFHRAAKIDPLVATRIAVGLHDSRFQTPYFPDSSSQGLREIGLSFLYANSIIQDVRAGQSIESAMRRVFNEIERVALHIHARTGLRVRVDYSLSPWMEDSVAEIYRYFGFSVTEPGATFFTWRLNRLIRQLANPHLATGFNEVMLPYAEDSLLVDYGARGLLRARDFLTMAMTCVAGVDMVVVPESQDRLAGIIADAMSIAWVKSSPMSIRVIPVSAQVGDTINLGRFGRIPVISY